MSEHTHSEAVHSDPTLSAGPPSTCDVCQADPCSQIAQDRELEHHSTQDIVSDCMPDGQGGCQRSAPGSPSSCCSPTYLDSARGPCCQSDSDVCELSCQDGRRLGSSPPCALDSPSKGCHQGAPSLAAEDDCCSESAPKDISTREQACPVDIGPTVHGDGSVVALAAKDDCCSGCAPSSLSAQGQTCPVVTRSPANKNDALTAEDDHCSGCASKSLSVREQACLLGTGPTTGKKDNDVAASTVTTSDESTCGKVQNAKCRPEATFGRFSEVACCCPINWRIRPPKQRYQQHPHSHSHRSHPLPEPKTNGDVEKGGACVQTLRMTVDGMDCPSCERKLATALLTLPSVQNVKVSSFTCQASLTYTEGFVLPPDIAKRAKELTGFTCVPVDEAGLEGKHRLLRIKFQPGPPREIPVLPSSVVILKTSRTESSVIFHVQYDATVIQPRSVLDIFVSSGGSFLPPSRPNASAQIARDVTSLFRRTLLSTVLCIPVLIFSWAPLPPHPIIYGAISLFLATCIQIYIGGNLYVAAFYAVVRLHTLDMDTLVAVSSTIAYGFSLVAYVMQVAGHEFSTPFFETPTLLLTLISLGNLISMYARRRATSALDSLGTLQPDFVQIVSADSVTVAVTHVDLVHARDVLRVLPNTLIPTDGMVLRGTTQIDESALTGESLPVDKDLGAPLIAGTRNVSHSIDMEVTRVPAESTLAEFAALVTSLQETRLPVQDLADSAAALLAPVILAIAVVTFVVWIIVGSFVRREDLGKASLMALRYTIAVLVVSCPCAVVLCVPMVIVITGAIGMREGVVFKTATALQQAIGATVAVFDKTGTLTLGEMGVVQAHIAREEAVGTILALVSQDPHPVAHAVDKYIRSTYPRMSAVPLVAQFQSFPGKGLEMTINGMLVRGGNPGWLGLETEPLYSLMMQEALTMFAVTIDTEVVAFFGLADSARPSAAAAVAHLQNQGIPAHIISGDAPPVVRVLAERLGISQKRILGGCLPAEKVAYVRALQANGARVMFIGDGTNDTPALAAADISVAMGSGTDVARSAADVIFVAPDLARALGALLRLSRSAVWRVQLNFVWAVVYNLSAVLLAAGVFVKFRLPPEYAALGEMVSVVPVILVAWSLWIPNLL